MKKPSDSRAPAQVSRRSLLAASTAALGLAGTRAAQAEQKPLTVSLDGRALAEGDAWSFDPKAERLIIKTRAYADGSYAVSWR